MTSIPLFRKNQLIYAAVLLAGATAMFLAVFGFHFVTGRTLLWQQDAVSQYYNFFVYEGQYLREVFGNLISGNGLVVPEFTYNLGYGSDVQTAMGGMITDPLNILSAFCPPEAAEALFCFLIYVRFVAAIFAFNLFARSRDASRPSAFASSLAYGGTGYLIFWACLRHPNFLNAAILLPLLFMFADRIFQKRSPLPFIITLTLTFAFSVYFSYWICLLFLGYCLVRYFFGPRERSLKDFGLLVGRFVICIAIAFCISAVISLPMVYALLSMGRVGESAAVPLLFSFAYYLSIPLNMTGGVADIMGQYVGAVLLVADLLFLSARRLIPAPVWKPLAIGLVACWVLMFVPAFGSLMNGFGYASDRWMLMLGFCSSYGLCLVLPYLHKLQKKDWVRCGIVLAVFLILSLVGAFADGSVLAYVPCLLLPLAFVGMLLIRRWRKPQNQAMAVAGACFVCTLCVCLVYYAPAGGNYAKEFSKGMNVWSSVTNGPVAAAASVGDEGDYRIDYAGTKDKKNRSLVLGVRGIDFFTSYYNQAVDDFRQEMEYTDSSNHHAYEGSDSRLASEVLVGAKYVVAKKGKLTLVPAGYELVKSTDKYDVYRFKIDLPLAFTYGSWISRKTYEALPVQERQEAILSTCVLGDSSKSKHGSEEAVASSTPEATKVDAKAKEAKVKLVPGEGIELRDGKIAVTKRNAKLTLKTTGLQANSEVYVRFAGFDYEGTRIGAKAKQGSSLIRRAKVLLNSLTWTSTRICRVKAKAGKHKAEMVYKTEENNSYGDKHEWCLNLGRFGKAPKTITVTFEFRGVYSYDALQVLSQPTDSLLDAAKDVSSRAIEDVSYGADCVTAQVKATAQSELAFFSLPYSAGWTATVDGQDAQVLRANTGFMAVEVGQGTHEVQLRYSTPGRSKGALLTVLGLIALAVLLVLRNRRPKHTRGKHSAGNISRRMKR